MNIKIKFEEDENEIYRCIIYKNKEPISNADLLEKKQEWIKIAKKDPLKGIALIQALSRASDVEAAFLQCIYHTYKKFLENGEHYYFEQLFELILSRQEKFGLKLSLAKHLRALIDGEKIFGKEEKRAKKILDCLINGFEKTILTENYKIHPEQKVQVPEMNQAHNAFPDLFKFENTYYIAFREGKSHVDHLDLGKIRILKGKYNEMTKTWGFENQALLSTPEYDLRDPHFFVNNENQLMLIMGGSKIEKKGKATTMVPHVATLIDERWTVEPTHLKSQWIWRVTWNLRTRAGYALSYGKAKLLSLLKTEDGKTFEKITDVSLDRFKEHLNEATIRFKPDGTLVALIRAKNRSLIATATLESDYKDWKFQKANFRLGGPNFLICPDGKMIAGTRQLFLNPDNTLDCGTVIALMDETGITPLMRLKSKGDTGYPGMVLEADGTISFLYYSTEKKGETNLLITRINLSS